MGRLSGKVVLLTGAARGLGAAQAAACAKEGAQVVFRDLEDEDGRTVEHAIRAAGGEANYVHLDVAQEPDWIEAIRAVVQHYGRLTARLKRVFMARLAGWRRSSLASFSSLRMSHLS